MLKQRAFVVGLASGVVLASLLWLSLYPGLFAEKRGEGTPKGAGKAPDRRIALADASTAFPAGRVHELAAVKLDEVADLLKVSLKAGLAGGRKFLSIDIAKAASILADYQQCEGLIGIQDSNRGLFLLGHLYGHSHVATYLPESMLKSFATLPSAP